MKRLFIVSLALVALVGSAVGLYAVEGRTFTGSPGGSADPDRREYKSYEFTEEGKTVRLTMPEGLAVVRGILMVGNYSGGDSRELYRGLVWRVAGCERVAAAGAARDSPNQAVAVE
jgi:hypothetical protein